MPQVIWLYSGSLGDALDAATWLDTTSELRNMGWQVILVAAGPSGAQYIGDTEVFCIPRPKQYLLRQIVYHFRFLKFLRGQIKNVDVVLFHPMSAVWFLPLRIWRFLSGDRGPLLAMDIRSVPMEQRKRQGWRGQLRDVFVGFVRSASVCWVDGYLTITRRLAEAIHIPAHKLWGEWPSGVNPTLFARAIIGRCWPLPGQSIHLVYIGALQHERNLITLCRAVEQANSDAMAFSLLLVGDGTERVGLERIANASQGQIRVAARVPHEQIPDILAWAHIGVLPFPDEQRFRVSSPIKLFEYMAAGLPILATRISCHTDVVEDGEYAFWAENAEVSGLLQPLQAIWKNQRSLADMGNKASRAAQNWTWHESASKLKAALEFGLNQVRQ